MPYSDEIFADLDSHYDEMERIKDELEILFNDMKDLLFKYGTTRDDVISTIENLEDKVE
jgi:hypothetical protein